MNALVTIETLTPAIVFSEGGVESIVSKLEAEVRAIPTDISTDGGRKAVASLAYKVARSKTALDDMGKELVSGLKAQAGKIDAERRVIRDRLDALKDEVRKPLTDWGNAEQKRTDDHENALEEIELTAVDIPTTFAEIQQRINRLVVFSAPHYRDWREFKQRADQTIQSAHYALDLALKAAKQREDEAAGLARLRAEQVAREQKEREEAIARQAAERARREAEQKAAAAAEAARREQERVEAERHAARLEAVRAENERREAQLRADAAEAARIEQAAQAERDRVAAAERAKREQEAAIEAERKRAADAAAKAAREAAEREADMKHRARINRAAAAALVQGGLSADAAQLAITLIAKRQIPHVSISY